jgi:hypothetical protein
MAGSSIYETGFKPKVGHDFLAILPMINRGFWSFERSESRYKVGRVFLRPTIQNVVGHDEAVPDLPG